jgi:class 3 adenylate cyclase/DNA-binding SARP family transcriptional activator
MEFRILGPLEVRDGDREVRLRAGKQRALLALLLVNANRTLAIDRIVDDLWGEDVPESAQKMVQIHVSKLRKVLAPGLLHTRPPGYSLQLAPDEIDLHRFEQLLAKARTSLDVGRAEEASADFRAALELWRGPALAEFASEPFALAERARLEEVRISALEGRVEADLLLGRHGALVGELEALIARYPLREGLRRQHMLALYRSGRQAEALTAYQEARRSLADELGIEPSSALRGLEREILQQDSSLDLAAPPVAPGEAAPVPAPAHAAARVVAADDAGAGAETRSGRLAPAEERKLATVLFADLVGATALASEQDPERTRALLERFYDAMAGEIDAAGGTVEKFAGDAVMAAFGAPTAQEDHAERALHAALSMRRRLAELFGDALQVRIGVNTGDVVVGRSRADSSFVTGDAVNVAARLEQAADPGEILAGERTVAAVRGAFEFSETQTVEAKGKAEGVGCRSLVRSVTLTRPRGVTGLPAAFVGRRAELELLQATYRRVLDGREPHLVTIMGDPGVGKTRLAGELGQWLAGQSRQPLQRTGRCQPYGQATYWALAEVLKEHLGILDSDPPETVREGLGSREILALALGLDVAGDLHPLAVRERLHEAWVEFLEELAERPAIVVIEDLHWAEEPLLDLLERIARDVHGPLLLLCTARPELLGRRPAWGGGRRNASLLWLEALTPDEASALLGQLVAPERVGELRELLVERAEGNPFFLEELVGAVIDVGVAELETKIPDSVQALLAARIDALDPDEKAALQAASVIGRVFWAGPVGELLGGGQPDWATLEDRDFIRRRSGSSMAGESEYAFKHALTREVAYASLLKAKRARLHAGFAGWLERFGDGRDDLAPFLGHHYAEAARPDDADLAWAGEEEKLEPLREKAVHWLRRAAELAVGRYDIDEGLRFLGRAVDLTSDMSLRSSLWREIGRANALKYDGEAFVTAMQKSLELCTDRATCGAGYALLAFHASSRSGMWNRGVDEDAVEGWIEQALELSPPESAARAQALAARAFLRPARGAEAAREASAIADRLRDIELRSYAWAARAAVAFEQLHFDEASALATQRFDLLPEISDPDHILGVYEAAVPALAGQSDLDEARRVAHAHVELSRTLTPHHRIHGVALTLEVQELAGDWETIRNSSAEVEEAVAANSATPCRRNPRSLLVCAAAHAEADDDDEAARLERAADASGIEDSGSGLAGPRLRLALLRGDLAAVERLLTASPRFGFFFGPASIAARLDALAALRDRERIEQEAPRLLRNGAYTEPFALRALGIARADETLIDQAQSRFSALGLDWYAAQTSSLSRPAERG